MSSRTPSPHFDTIDALIDHLLADPEREAVAAEIGALRSIYGDDAVSLWRPPESSEYASGNGSRSQEAKGTIRYEVATTVSPPSDPSTDYPLTLLVSVPTTYPESSAPQLQLLSRYIGSYGVDAALFGAVLRTYISRDGVEWTEGGVCVFDGVEWVRERCMQWLGEKMTQAKVDEITREDEKTTTPESKTPEALESLEKSQQQDSRLDAEAHMPEGVEIVVAEPILDRKSVFIGRACSITHPSQVPQILAHLVSDRRIARAAHPIINAWRCRVGDNMHQDNDDDGETAAGGRLAHLLQILEVENVLVVVTRYYGGIHLGPDRFKHINQAARNALELGGFLDAPGAEAHNSGRKKGKSTRTKK